ncbi:arylamine N-acetyltransferase [soil metagenome]
MTASRLDRYVQRIGHTAGTDPTLANLQQICWLHQLAIPFENLDIALQPTPISLNADDILTKVVDRRRGGYCFEQNGLLALMLEDMGYTVTMGYATWITEDGEHVPPFDHLLLRVTIPGIDHAWVADVGFGRNTPSRPVALVEGVEALHVESSLIYTAVPLDLPDRQWSIRWRSPQDTTWQLLYDLDLRPRTMADFQHRHVYHQTSPDSVFQKGPICSKPTIDGRITLAGDTLVVTTNGERQEIRLLTVEEQRHALAQWFDITLEEHAP